MSPAVAQCVCEICCCGRHKCPHRPKAIVPWGPCVMSEYSSQYHPHCISANPPIVPESKLFSSIEPISNKTTNRVDYVAHDLCEQPYKYKPPDYKPPAGRMEDTTLYKKEFTPKLCPPPQSMQPPQRKMCSAKFDGQPTYRTDYRPWDLPPIRNSKPQLDRPALPKFDAVPIYRQEYIPHCIPLPQSFKPSYVPKVNAPFQGDTSYRTDFTEPPLKPKTPPKPVTIPKIKVPLDCLTTNRKDFTPKEICPNPPIKPSQTMFDSKEPMSKMTTNREDFRDWGPQVIERGAGPEYEAPTGDRYFDSTYRSDYFEKPLCPTLSIRPPELKRCETKFDGTTNYRHDYLPWDVKPEVVNKTQEWCPPEVPLESMTTSRSSYVPYSCIQVPKPYKPETCFTESGPFDDKTSYRTDYIPKEVCPCCPAAFLDKDLISPDGYKFERYDERGHQLYQNVGKNKQLLPALPVKS